MDKIYILKNSWKIGRHVDEILDSKIIQQQIDLQLFFGARFIKNLEGWGKFCTEKQFEIVKIWEITLISTRVIKYISNWCTYKQQELLLRHTAWNTWPGAGGAVKAMLSFKTFHRNILDRQIKFNIHHIYH